MAKSLGPLDVLSTLISFDSVSARPNLPIVSWIADYLDAAGARVEILPGAPDGKANLLATVGPDRPGGVVLSGHTDVVPVDGQTWSSDPFSLALRDGRLYGRGTADMKGFVSLAVALASFYGSLPLRRPIHIALSHDEEVGCLGAPALVETIVDRGLAPAVTIVGEPTRLKPVNGHKAATLFRLEVRGKPAHSSEPTKGTNAILFALEFLAFLRAIFDEREAVGPMNPHFTPAHSTFNIGRIDGGEAVNIVAGACRVDWEFRTVPGDDTAGIVERVERFIRDDLEPRLLRSCPEGSIRLSQTAWVPMLAPEPDGPAEALVRQLTGTNAGHTVAYGSDAGFFQAAGMSTVVCGPGDIAQAHKPDEFITLQQFDAGEAFLRAVGDWCTR